jgi:hypothetical protein
MFGSNTIDFEVDITNEDIEVVSLWWSFRCSFSAVSTPIFFATTRRFSGCFEFYILSGSSFQSLTTNTFANFDQNQF